MSVEHTTVIHYYLIVDKTVKNTFVAAVTNINVLFLINVLIDYSDLWFITNQFLEEFVNRRNNGKINVFVLFADFRLFTFWYFCSYGLLMNLKSTVTSYRLRCLGHLQQLGEQRKRNNKKQANNRGIFRTLSTSKKECFAKIINGF